MKESKSYFTKGELALWIGSITLIVTAFCLFDRESYLTLIASLIGVTSLIFAAKGNPVSQILMIVFSILYGIISYSFAYYGEMITYLGMTLPMSVIALVAWLKHPYEGKKSEVQVNRIGKKDIVWMILLTTVVTIAFYFILEAFDTANIVPSTVSVTTSFLAVFLTFRRSPYYALAYAANDIVLIILWVLASMEDIHYVSVVVCFVVFLVNDLYGFLSWRKMEKIQRKPQEMRRLRFDSGSILDASDRYNLGEAVLQMNNLQLIEQVLYYIDEHINEPITFERLAEQFGYSAFHFHRIFSTVTEQTITDYMKKRRLTLAHMQLCETEKTVTEIALSKGFNSIQSFNRTFKETFGMTPLEARKRKPKITYRSVETIVTGYMKRVYMEGEFSLTPHFEERDEFLLVGYRGHTRDGYGVIGEAWYNLKTNMERIARKNPNTMYGFEDYMEEFSSDPLQFYYMAAVEADPEAEIPEGMIAKRIPKAMYAVFTVNGNNGNGEIGKAFRYIYHVWLPQSEYCLDENFLADFEYYDERWDCQSGAAQMELYIPVRRLED